MLSALAPKRNLVTPALAQWLDRQSERSFLSVITLAEVEDGIAKARRGAAHARADQLAAWLDAMVTLYSSRILPLDSVAARLAGRLSDAARARGHAPGFPDLAIAATAQAAGFMLLTRNLPHFLPMNMSAHDPFASLPPE